MVGGISFASNSPQAGVTKLHFNPLIYRSADEENNSTGADENGEGEEGEGTEEDAEESDSDRLFREALRQEKYRQRKRKLSGDRGDGGEDDIDLGCFIIATFHKLNSQYPTSALWSRTSVSSMSRGDKLNCSQIQIICFRL